MKRVAAVAGLMVIAVSFPVMGEEHHDHPPPEKLGTVSFPTSCDAAVGAKFRRGIALLHSFAYSSARQAFEEVASADPACAMAHWGAAMSYYHQLWSPPDAADLEKGWAQAQQAASLDTGTPRERQYIAAAVAFFRDAGQAPHATRAAAYAAAMGEVARGNPDDTEAQVFDALALLATASPADRTHANQKQAAALLEPIFQAQPDHPGAAHYLIHAYDSAELAARGLVAARAYSKIAPSAPHALHMPSHIYTRLGLWDDSIASNLAARRAAHEQQDLGEELHAMDYLAYAYLQSGRDADAARVVADLGLMPRFTSNDFKISYAATAMPVRYSMERQQWTEVMSLEPLADSPPHVAAIVYWARAVAAARSGHPGDGNRDRASIEACRQRLQASGNAYWATQVEVLGEEAQAWQLSSAGNPAEAVASMRRASRRLEADALVAAVAVRLVGRGAATAQPGLRRAVDRAARAADQFERAGCLQGTIGLRLDGQLAAAHVEWLRIAGFRFAGGAEPRRRVAAVAVGLVRRGAAAAQRGAQPALAVRQGHVRVHRERAVLAHAQGIHPRRGLVGLAVMARAGDRP